MISRIGAGAMATLVTAAVVLFASSQPLLSAPKRYATAPLDITPRYIPVDYQGQDPDAIYDALQTEPQGQFESTQAYEKRLAAVAQRPLVGAMTVKDTFAFRVNCGATYDADERKMTVVISANDGWSIETRRQEQVDSSFDAENFYSATSKVTTYVVDGTVLTVDNISSFLTEHKNDDMLDTVREYLNSANAPLGDGEFEYDIYSSFYMSAAAAKSIKYNLSALVVCTLDAFEPNRYTETLLSSSQATFDTPQIVVQSWRAIHVNVKRILVYNKRTGQIITSILPDKKPV